MKSLEHLVEVDEFINEIESCLETLTPREQRVIKMRFGLGEYKNPMTLEEVARTQGVKRECIRQIEARALRKLRHPSLAGKLQEFVNSDL